MKVLDKYVAKNFLVGYIVSFCVLVGLRIVIDMFLNIDEFTEHADLGTLTVLKNIAVFYAIHATVYFKDFAGIITVVAAVFSIGRMVRANELVAVMASGLSLKRVISPIIVLGLSLTTAAFIIDQELIIPRLADKLVRRHDALPGEESYRVPFISDENGSLIWSGTFDVKTATLDLPSIITRRQTDRPGIWDVTDWIKADKAVYNYETKKLDLINGQSVETGAVVESYATDITPRDIPVRSKAEHKALLSWLQLRALAKQGQKIKDLAELFAYMHFHTTEPIINFVMLMVALPILACRDPKSMKSAILLCFVVTIACFITTFICKMVASEVVFHRVMPELWAWLPVFIFLPVVFLELDSMKT